MTRHEPPLTLDEAATYLNVSRRYMRRLVAERRIAYHKVGHFLRFRAVDLERFLQSGRVEPVGDHLPFDVLRGTVRRGQGRGEAL
jgi:excisionase family DNA binding protein